MKTIIICLAFFLLNSNPITAMQSTPAHLTEEFTKLCVKKVVDNPLLAPKFQYSQPALSEEIKKKVGESSELTPYAKKLWQGPASKKTIESNEPISALGISLETNLLVTGSLEKNSIIIWDLNTLKPKSTKIGSPVYSVRFFDSLGTQYVLVVATKKVSLINLSRLDSDTSIVDFKMRVKEEYLLEQLPRLSSSDLSNSIAVIRYETRKEESLSPSTIPSDQKTITVAIRYITKQYLQKELPLASMACFNQENTMAAIGYENGIVDVLDTSTHLLIISIRLKKRPQATESHIQDLKTFSHDNAAAITFSKAGYLVICKENLEVSYWDINKNDSKREVSRTNPNQTVQLQRGNLGVSNPSQQLPFLATIITKLAFVLCNKNIVNIYMMETGKFIDSVELPFADIRLIRASPKSRFIFFVSKELDNGDTYFVNGVFDRLTRKCCAFLHEYERNEIIAAEFSTDGKSLVTADAEKIRIWDLAFDN